MSSLRQQFPKKAFWPKLSYRPGAVSQSEGELAMKSYSKANWAATYSFTSFHLSDVCEMYSIVIMGEDYNGSSILQTINTKTGGTKTRKVLQIRGWGRNLAFPQVRATDSLCSTLQRAETSLGETRFLGIVPQRSLDLFSTPNPYSFGGGVRMTHSLHRLSVTSPWYIFSRKAEGIHALW